MEIIRSGGQGDLVPQLNTALRKMPRDARERVMDEFVEGYVSAARVQAASWVGSVVITQISNLQAMEAQQAAASPIRAEIYASIVEDVALVARHAVRRLGGRP